MNRRPRPCVVCGRRVDGGGARCPDHLVGGARPRSCVVCGIQTRGNYCPDHDPQTEENRIARNPYRLAYKDGEYARNRQIRFERARGRCEACGVPLRAGEWESDHLIDLRDGGSNAIENLRILCRPCHKRKTAESRRNRRRHADG